MDTIYLIIGLSLALAYIIRWGINKIRNKKREKKQDEYLKQFDPQIQLLLQESFQTDPRIELLLEESFQIKPKKSKPKNDGSIGVIAFIGLVGLAFLFAVLKHEEDGIDG